MGGEFKPELLLNIYKQGVFPWPENDFLKLWFCPETRCVIEPQRVKVSKSLKSLLKKNRFQLKIDTDFEGVINNCAASKEGRESTWITSELNHAFVDLHKQGYAHSFEVWDNDELVGGLYGLALGTQFSGESMFNNTRDASKVAFVFLNRVMQALNFDFVDCQVPTDHLLSLGAQPMHREEFLENHSKAVSRNGRMGSWSDITAEFNLNQTSDLI